MPTRDGVLAAAEVLRGIVHRTPVFTSRLLDELAGCTMFLKGEHLQRGGAFKFRGATNAIRSLSPETLACGVVTFSSGNHAGAVALAAHLAGTSATVVMPHDSPAVKVAAVKAYGGEVVFYDRAEQSREQMAREIAEERGATIIPPYDDARIIHGAGTAALELVEEVPDLDLLFVPCGGGGLLSGSLLAVSDRAIKTYGVEPEAADDGRRSLEAGKILTVDNPITIADGARTPSLGVLNFEVIQRLAAGIVTATDDELRSARKFVGERLKQVVEPTGVLGVAAALNGSVPVRGKRVGVILSGGNTDLGF